MQITRGLMLTVRKRPLLARPALLDRRAFIANAIAWSGGMASSDPAKSSATDELEGIEKHLGGRLGLAAIDTGTGARLTHRASERFAMCSTFKWMLAAAVLDKVRAEHTDLDRRLPFSRSDLIAYSPVTQAHISEGSLSIRSLCKAAVEVSDNTAANTLLRFLGGPEALTRYLRGIGDSTTRFDRYELDLNANISGDPRDTTTPEAMIAAMRTILVGTALAPESRDTLLDWMRNCQTGFHRLRAGLPRQWTVGDKTGTGSNGATNDNAIAWPPGRSPILIAAYLSGSGASAGQLEEAHARIGAIVGATFS
jgi:beta-lactamase class A